MKNCVLFGGAINNRETVEYQETILIGKYLSNKGYIIKSGGYGGMMEAVSKGSTENDGVAIGYTCKTFPSTNGNRYLSKVVVCDDIYDRLRGLIEDNELYIFQRGGIGTLSELFLVLDVTRKKKEKPIIILIGLFWLSLFKELEFLIGDCSLTIVKDYDEFITII